MKIDKRLNLVFPIEHAELGTIYVHSMPIARDVFERHFLILSQTTASIFGAGLGIVAGPSVAALMLRKIAEDAKLPDGSTAWEGPGGIKNTLMAEIIRLSNVVMPSPEGGGWITLPLIEALRRGILSAQEAREAEDIVVFFTCVSSVLRQKQAQPLLKAAGGLWSFTTTLLSCTEFSASLPTSTVDASSGAKAAA